MFNHKPYNYQEILIRAEKPISPDKFQYCIELFFRISSICILLFSIWLISLLVYYSFKN